MTVSRTTRRLITGAAVACCVVVRSHAQVYPRAAITALAYTAFYCVGTDCDYYPAISTGTHVVTPFTEIEGSQPTWSPDATRIAYASYGDIYIVDETAIPVNVTASTQQESSPAWSPDGLRIAFVSDRDAHPELYVMNADGSSVVRVTTDVGVSRARPAWSPDSRRMAFDCEVDPGNRDVCVINVDGTGFSRLTADPAQDSQPAWSPDGARIAFVSTRFGSEGWLALMNSDGTAVARLGPGIVGWEPAWSPDGGLIAFTSFTDSVFGIGIYTTVLDGSRVDFAVADASNAAWSPAFSGVAANFTADCSNMTLTCTFDAYTSIGSIGDYTWTFGDGARTSGSAATVSHAYADGGYLTVALQVTDTRGVSATQTQTVRVNRRPVASFTVSCDDSLTCVFDWSASYDPDGYIASTTWKDFTGAATSTGYGAHSMTIRYAAPGTYSATLVVGDDFAATASTTRTFTVGKPSTHVGDLDASIAIQHGTWSVAVTIAVHRADHSPLGSAIVTAVWNNGTSASCTTNAAGTCVISRSAIGLKTSVTLTVTNVAPDVYSPSSNHDPDGESNGTTITVTR